MKYNNFFSMINFKIIFPILILIYHSVHKILEIVCTFINKPMQALKYWGFKANLFNLIKFIQEFNFYAKVIVNELQMIVVFSTSFVKKYCNFLSGMFDFKIMLIFVSTSIIQCTNRLQIACKHQRILFNIFVLLICLFRL